ncbi:MAG: DUF3261 domain-containing protein [Xanthomonadaceae bacterium]|nr:DUF3261 domain-containing protein [Xanthomonadaceae bacterium]
MDLLRTLLLFGLLVLTACASRPPAPAVALPPLHLPPSALPQPLALQQRLEFHFGRQARTLDALLEADAGEVRLLVQALGQTGVRLRWDGNTLQQQRAPWLPPAVRAERVLDDLQFALWPAASIRAVLPAGWTLEDDGQQRRLSHDGQAWLVLTRIDAGHLQLDNRAEGYQLQVTSMPLDGDAEAQP